MDDDKTKDELDAKDDDSDVAKDVAGGSSSGAKKSKASPKPVRADEDDEDEDDEDEDEDDEDEDDEDEDEDEDDEDEDEDEDDEDEPAPKVSAKAKPKSKPVAARSAVKAKAAKVEPKPRPGPLDIPLPTRNSEIVKGLAASIVGYLAFWYGWSIYSQSIQKHHVNYFSHSAWAFLIAFFLVMLAGFLFVRRERVDEKPADDKKKQGVPSKGKPYRSAAETAKEAPKVARGVDMTGVLLAAVVGGPFFGIYWWKASRIWAELYANDNPPLWALFAAFLLFTVWGIFHAMRPPTYEEEKARRMPTRRVLALLMTPFALVYGMIWLASLYPPWPT